MRHLDPYGFMIPEIFPRGFSDEYQTVYDAFITKPPDDIANEQNAMVQGMIADGDWQTKDIFYITAAQSAVDSLLNWINPGTHDLTVVNMIAADFVVYRGWIPNGVNEYLNTNYNPNTDATNYLQNSACFGYYNRNSALNDHWDGTVGNVDTFNTGINRRAAAGQAGHAINDATLTDRDVSVIGNGLFISTRTAVNVKILYANGAAIITDVTVSTGIPTQNFYLLAYNDDGVAAGFGVDQLACAFAGGGVTQTNVNNFETRLEKYLDYIGAGVIP